MLARCYKPSTKQYAGYGGRGITVCEQWRTDFWQFHDDMGPRPARHVVDRIDNDLGYAPDNCRWATYQQSNANRRWCITVEGKTLKEHMRDNGKISQYRMVTKRIHKGMAVQDALTIPSRRISP